MTELIYGSSKISTSQETITAESKIDQLQKSVENLEKNFDKSRIDLITVLSVFVGLITYLGLEIQVFKMIDNPLMIIGVSIFFIASILLFVLTINIILRVEKNAWRWFSGILYFILIILLIFSVYYIKSGYNDYLRNKNFVTEISILTND